MYNVKRIGVVSGGRYPPGCYVIDKGSRTYVTYNYNRDKKAIKCNAQRRCLCMQRGEYYGIIWYLG